MVAKVRLSNAEQSAIFMAQITIKELQSLVKTGEPIRKPVGSGLYFKINNSGSASWFYRYAINGSRREFTLGEYPEVSLSEANRLAAEAKNLVKSGLDPIEESKREFRQKTITCDALFDDWFHKDIAPRLKHPNIPYRIYTKDISPVIGKLSLHTVSPIDVRRVLERVRESGRPTIANDTLMYMKQLFRHGRKLNLLLNNPAEDFNERDAGGEEKSRSRHLSEEELVKSFEVFRQHIRSFGIDNYIACSLFVMLGVRKSELCEAKWSEFDLENAVWDLPSGRSKTGAPISIPLSTQALALLRTLKVRAGFSDYVFPARRASGSEHMGPDTLNRAISKCFGREPGRKKQPPNLMGDIPAFSVHDLRRTFRSLCAKLRISGEVAERCLNHKLKGVEGIYNRHDYFDERRDAHQKVSDYVEPILQLNKIL